jgi:hypothetical protein
MRINSEKKIAAKCKVYEVVISDTKYKRFEFIQSDGKIISQWLQNGDYLNSEIEEKSLEKLFNMFKPECPA